MRRLITVLSAGLVLASATPASAEGENRPPVARDDTITVGHTGAVIFLVGALRNDWDPDGDALVYTAVTPASKGDAYLQYDKLYYKPRPYESGVDSFTYTVSDGHGNTATATVTAHLYVQPRQVTGVGITQTADTATLTWSATEHAVEYRIFRSGVLFHTTTELTWTDTGIPDEATHTYSISAVNGAAVGGRNSESVTRGRRPSAPADLNVVPADDPTSLHLSWDNDGATGPWQVYRDGSPLATTDVPRFDESGLVTGRQYSYQVQHLAVETGTSATPESAMSAAVAETPVQISTIGRYFRESGWTWGPLGPVAVPERAVPGGRQQDHAHGLITQQDGADPFSIRAPFAAAYSRVAGPAGDLGFPLGEHECGYRDSGCGQLFEGGSIWDSSSTPVLVVRQVMEDGWAASGWEEGPLGYPVSEQVALRDGVMQEFEGGDVYWSARTGSHGVSSPIWDRYAASGVEKGALGYPVADEVESDRGLRQSFQGGTIWWSPSNDGLVVSAALQPAWERSGWDAGPLGEPTGAEKALRGGRFQLFTGGSVYWSPATGAQAVRGAVRDAWARSGWENGPLGYPTSGEVAVPGGARQSFQGGTIWWSPSGGARLVVGAIEKAWGKAGYEKAPVGRPTSEELLLRGGRGQFFSGGTMFWSPGSGAHAVLGAIYAAWGRSGFENGPLGYPTSGDMTLRGGRWQPFQGGAVYWTPSTGANTVRGAIRDAWGRTGWETGPLGYPVSEEIALRGGRGQIFQSGSIYWSPSTGAHAVRGAIRDAWAGQGWENGRLGYPTSGELRAGSTIRQTFQGGSITFDVPTGRRTVSYR
ncbi:Ig-like domain-containing protein [Blastococcus sp. LR1]|uniref:Ig-like domain-containing protein n=1 Tax=Blastococcus sp. LR1 TaxID=2877000 RepID=UPI001CCEA0F3|nr:Ig-like domain-containing protein [Blastococcus sp. LR1]MCA0145848.1 cadherin-like domain-containing protein [Blastococcus sp. LR1]